MECKFAEQYNYNTVMSQMLKDTGITTKIVKQYLPVINKLVNKYLQILDFFVSFKARPLHPIVVYLDFETTGLSIIKDHICEFGALSHKCSATFSTVVHPPSLPSQFPAVHGILDEELMQGPFFNEA